MNDLSSETHDNLDNAITSNSFVAKAFAAATVELHGDQILSFVLRDSDCVAAYANIWPLDPSKIDLAACGNLLASRQDIQSILRTAHADKKYAKIRGLPVFHQQPKQSISRHFIAEERRAITENFLHHAYTRPFRGQNATQLLDYLLVTDASVRAGEVIYAKSVSIVQSSGTGKSRMLTEIGKQIFTLPICLRGPQDPGYPPGDHVVYEYFSKIQSANGLSISAHAAVARFLGAAHTMMLRWLRAAQTTRNAEELLTYWYTLMEASPLRTERERFFRDVVDLAHALDPLVEQSNIQSPKRGTDLEPDRPGFRIHEYSDKYYRHYAKTATEKLAAFTSHLTPKMPIVVTYFDEAHALGESLWCMLRLLSQQDLTTPMWYIFLDTKSTISYFNPALADRHSKRLRKEGVNLLPPYIAVGFDQIVISEDRGGVVKMGDLQSIRHLAKYGRPMWNVQYVEGQDDEQIRLAADKLICEDFMKFDPTDRHQVLAVLSQRVCVDTVLFSSDALELAERSVASHMRLLTGFASDQLTFYTYSPSEPMLALAAALLLYNKQNVLGQVLDTFSKQLCEAGVVEKGLLGELAGRTLLTVARDLAAPKQPNGFSPNLLAPILLMHFVDTLFGNTSWCGPHRNDFQDAFKDTYVNFTHWIVTKDPIPEGTSPKLLANLWARGAALQCSFNQESLDLQIVTYKGSIAPDATFDIKNLSVAIIQIKDKSAADLKALRSLRPIGLPRDLHRSLPYLAVVMELGNESYQQHKGPIQVTAPEEVSEGAFEVLWSAWLAALTALREYEEKKAKAKKVKKAKKDKKVPFERTKLQDNVNATRAAMDAYNRYTVNVRGASPTVYGSLKDANIVTQFATLMKVTTPSSTAQEVILQHMRPLERLGEGSAYTAWMTDYADGNESSDDNGDDLDDDEHNSMHPEAGKMDYD